MSWNAFELRGKELFVKRTLFCVRRRPEVMYKAPITGEFKVEAVVLSARSLGSKLLEPYIYTGPIPTSYGFWLNDAEYTIVDTPSPEPSEQPNEFSD